MDYSRGNLRGLFGNWKSRYFIPVVVDHQNEESPILPFRIYGQLSSRNGSYGLGFIRGLADLSGFILERPVAVGDVKIVSQIGVP